MKLTIKQMRNWIGYNRQGLRKGTSTLSHSQRNEFAQVCGLGNGTPTFISYEEACKIVRKAGIETKEEFRSWNRPQGMPSNPNSVYKNSGWESWPQFLDNNGKRYCLRPIPYVKACKIVRKAGIKSSTEFFSWNRPEGMPSVPDRTYKNSGWESWPQFLGTGIPFVAMSYSKACKIVRKAGIKTPREFQSWNRPQGMPSNPNIVYKDSRWSSWPEFLGTGFVSYSKACKIVRKAGIKSSTEFFSWNRPDGMPSAPDRTYKNSGWESWTEFLGTKRRKS